jgi:hypothetical protein
LGHITILEESRGRIVLGAGKEPAETASKSLPTLKELLRETEAYRSFYARADKEVVLRKQ